MTDTTHTAQWHADRATGVGGSDVPVILGLSRWESPYGLWLIKTGRVTPDDAGNEFTEFGHRAEPMLADWFADAHDPLRVVGAQRSVTHPDFPHHRATLDGLVVEGAGSDPIGVWEAKTTGRADNAFWQRVEPQVQWQMWVTGLDRAWVTVLADRSCSHRELVRDDDTIARIREAVEAFWWHVEVDVAPPVDDTEATADALGAAWPDPDPEASVELPDELVATLANLRQQRKELDGELRLLENEVKALLGDATAGTVGGVPVVTWRKVTSQRLDTKALEKAHPDLVAGFRSESSYRRLDVKGGQ